MKYLKLFERERRDIEDFYQIVFNMVKDKSIYLYDFYQDYDDNDLYEMIIQISVQDPFNDDMLNTIELFTICKDNTIKNRDGEDYIRGYFESDRYELFDEKDIIFKITFRFSPNSDVHKIDYTLTQNTSYIFRSVEIPKFQKSIDEFIKKVNSIYDYEYIFYYTNQDKLYPSKEIMAYLFCRIH